MAWVWLVVLGVCAHTVYLSMNVGFSRGRLGVNAPATTGNEEFERHYRAHINSIEQHVIFFPLLAVCSMSGSTTIAAVLGAIYLVGRIIYAASYVKAPESRGTGMMMGFLASVGLFLVSAFNVITTLI